MMSFTLPLTLALMSLTTSAKSISQKKIMDLNSAGGGHTVFCNPPYGRTVKDWVKKCSEEAKKPGTTIVLLIPARTDTSYFHDYIYQKPNVEIRFIRGRLKFGDGKNSAPFPSMAVIFRSEPMAKMTLSEAIEHCHDIAKKLGCCECAEEHLQLAAWLEELKQFREKGSADESSKSLS